MLEFRKTLSVSGLFDGRTLDEVLAELMKLKELGSVVFNVDYVQCGFGDYPMDELRLEVLTEAKMSTEKI